MDVEALKIVQLSNQKYDDSQPPPTRPEEEYNYSLSPGWDASLFFPGGGGTCGRYN